MNIGLILCDHVQASLQPVHKDYPDMFCRLLQTVIPNLSLEVFDATRGVLPDKNDPSKAYVLSGSSHSSYEDLSWIKRLSAQLRMFNAQKKKIIGVCFGHQLLAQTFGGEVQKSYHGWRLGVSENQCECTPIWMTQPKETFNLLNSHQDQVTILPPNATLIANNPHCPNYMFQLGRSILSIQGHPEFSKDYTRALIEQRKTQLPPKVYDHSVKSLSLPIDSTRFAQWVLNFIKY